MQNLYAGIMGDYSTCDFRIFGTNNVVFGEREGNVCRKRRQEQFPECIKGSLEEVSIHYSEEVIPAPMLYDMYSIWYETTNHTRTNLSSQTFWKQVQAWSSTQENWEIVEGPLDYDRTAKTTKLFFAKVQNKMHYAVRGHTSA